MAAESNVPLANAPADGLDIGKTETAFEIFDQWQSRIEIERLVSSNLDALIFDELGIRGFSEKVNRWQTPSRRLHLLMMRQVPTASYELLTAACSRHWMAQAGVRTRLCAIPWVSDRMANNPYKQSIIAVRFVERRNAVLFKHPDSLLLGRSQNTTMVREPFSALSGCVTVPATASHKSESICGSAIDIHRELLRRMGLSRSNLDFSTFLAHFRDASLPEIYLLLLGMCVTGRRALVVGDLRFDKPAIQACFENAMTKILATCGVRPLILSMPAEAPGTKTAPDAWKCRLTEIPVRLLGDPGWRRKVQLPSPQRSFFSATGAIARQLIEHS